MTLRKNNWYANEQNIYLVYTWPRHTPDKELPKPTLTP